MCQNARLKRFRDTCERLRSKYNFTNVDDFEKSETRSLLGLIDDAHKFIMEAVPKTGCSSWNVILLNNTEHKPLKLSADLNPHG